MVDARLDTSDMAALRHLSRSYPTIDAAVAEIARLESELVLEKGAIHILSDVHGEHVKLRHVINNASGMLRPIVEDIFDGRKADAELRDLMALIFYPQEYVDDRADRLATRDERLAFCRPALKDLYEIARRLGGRLSAARVERVLPDEYRVLMSDLLHAPAHGRTSATIDAAIDALERHGRLLHFLRLSVRLVRNLAIDELVIAGDCYDRGPRGDTVIDYLSKQPNVSFAWGNHDIAWLGACLGQEACIAHVLRVSIRYRRLSQLEEGYGITLQPLESLVRKVYGDDPAPSFHVKGSGLREDAMMARMQKAAAVMLYKLEGQTIARHPEWHLDHRRVLHTLDRKKGTITIDGKVWPLRDTNLPTVDPANPYALSAEEDACMDRLRRSFLASDRLWEHMVFLARRGRIALIRDDHLIFHGCVPVDEKGAFLEFPIDGVPCKGRRLFEEFDRIVFRAVDQKLQGDVDLLWYLWCGPISPLFGKDRITTLERDFIADKAAHHETKNPYFKSIHDASFCERVLAEFGIDPARGLIVNGHVPVKLEKGESPVKDSKKAVTIDGAFSEAYGDHGFTLVIEAGRTLLAKHHHFESVAAAVRDGVDIIPEITVIREEPAPRRVGHTEEGTAKRADIAQLERLIAAYRANVLH